MKDYYGNPVKELNCKYNKKSSVQCNNRRMLIFCFVFYVIINFFKFSGTYENTNQEDKGQSIKSVIFNPG